MSSYRQSVLSVMEMSTSRSSVYILCQCRAWDRSGLTLMCGLKQANRNPADNPAGTQSIKSKWGPVKLRISIRILGIALPNLVLPPDQRVISFRFMAPSLVRILTIFILLHQKEIIFFSIGLIRSIRILSAQTFSKPSNRKLLPYPRK